jgi:hypothetical protein
MKCAFDAYTNYVYKMCECLKHIGISSIWHSTHIYMAPHCRRERGLQPCDIRCASGGVQFEVLFAFDRVGGCINAVFIAYVNVLSIFIHIIWKAFWRLFDKSAT